MEEAGVISLFNERLAAEPEAVFAEFPDRRMTFGDIDRVSRQIAGKLTKLEVKSGDRVAVMMANSWASLATVFGLARSDVTWIPVNTRLRGPNLSFLLDHSDPALIICDSDLVATIADAAPALAKSKLLTFGAPDAPNSLEAVLLGPTAENNSRGPSGSSIFAIMYTSGTTGRPKGVMVSHQMMKMAGEGVVRLCEVQADDIFFVWEPLFHIGGAQLLLIPLLRRAHLHFAPRFSASRFWSEVKAANATHIHYLGGILQMLLKQAPLPDEREHRVRIAWGGACSADQWNEIESRFALRVRECYGMTEASSLTTVNLSGSVGSVGTPLPWFDVGIVDAAGRKADVGERGEIVIRSNVANALFTGYFRNEEATAKALRDGALHTGDLGSKDVDGNFFFHGRMTESIRVRGENVSAWEVEHVVAGHPLVEECAAIGVKADIGEQEIKLFVKPKDLASIDEQALSAWLEDRLPSFQNPRYICLVGDFERTPSQRIIKGKLSIETSGCWDRVVVRSPKLV
jgi:carnitine-CoA ligase